MSMGNSKGKIPLERVDAYRWRIPQSYNSEMRVPGMVYADNELIEQILEDNALQQVANVATLPGVVGYSLAMPDFHWGYGFPVGGVAATELFNNLPSGVGGAGMRQLSAGEMRAVMVRGSAWAVEEGYGFPEDLEVT